MKTIKSIKENVNVSEVLSNDKYDIYEGLSNEHVIEFTVCGELVVLVNNQSEYNAYIVSSTVANVSYEIKNEEVLNLFRELYKMTSNKFVKSVLVSVGQSKKYTEKQLSSIVGEMVKFENLTINF